MKVLKFGGTSVANAKNIEQAISIINNIDGKKIIVVSALGGITDLLINAITYAQNKDEEYKKLLLEVKKRHQEPISNLILLENQKTISEYIESSLSHISTILEGCFLLGEMSDKTKDIILSYGELLSSRIVFEKLKQESQNVNYIDSRQLISTNSDFGNAVVNFEITEYSGCRK